MSASLAAITRSRTRPAKAGRWVAVAAVLTVAACSLPDWADPAGVFDPDYGPAPQPVARADAKPLPPAPEAAAATATAKAEQTPAPKPAAKRTARATVPTPPPPPSTERPVKVVTAPAPPRRVASASSTAKPAAAESAASATRRTAEQATPKTRQTAPASSDLNDSPTPMIAAMTRGEAPPSFDDDGSIVPRRTDVPAEADVKPLLQQDAEQVATDVRTSQPSQSAMVSPPAPAMPERRPARLNPPKSAPAASAPMQTTADARVEPGQFPNSVSPVVQQTYRESLNAPRSYQEAIAQAGGGVSRGGAGLGEPVVISGEGVYQPAAYGGAAQSGGAKPAAVIQFRHGSVSLSSKDMSTIRLIADIAKRSNARIRIQGHASSRTGQMPVEKHLLANLRISADRADAVADALAREGIPYDRIYVEAKGDNAPIYNEAMPSGEAGNRRAEIFLEN